MKRLAAKGFTLVEALVALTILAVALMAAIKASGSMNVQQDAMITRLNAQWSAENMANELRLRGVFPSPGITERPCPQGNQAWLCIIDVTNTPNPNFRRVDIRVVDDQDRLGASSYRARLVVFLARLP